jgi:hypothetical protein
MSSIQEYVTNYTAADSARVAFAWNGKHAAEFQDANQQFRVAVATYCIEHPEQSSPDLLATLFRADAQWSREAWCSPHHFDQLASALLIRGGESALDSFADGLYASFDTYGACHQMQLPQHVIISLSESLQQRIPQCSDAQRKKWLEGALQLFDKLQRGVATQGWATLPPGTPASNVRVVWPRWYHRAWRRIKMWFGYDAA